jgi:hypothetical protein
MTDAVTLGEGRFDPIAFSEVFKAAGHEAPRRRLRNFDVASLAEMKGNLLPLLGGDNHDTVCRVNSLHRPLYHRLTSFVRTPRESSRIHSDIMIYVMVYILYTLPYDRYTPRLPYSDRQVEEKAETAPGHLFILRKADWLRQVHRP